MEYSWNCNCYFRSNEILHKYVHGYSDLKTKNKLKLTDKFIIASCTKSIFCSAIASLIEKKKNSKYFEYDFRISLV